MKIAVIGMGSIGRRHYQNLTDMGHDAYGFDIEDTFGFDFDAAVICTPTKRHIDIAMEFLELDIPTFIEKPLTDDLDELDIKTDTINMVACNLRFTSALQSAKSIAESTGILNIHARVCSSNPSRGAYGHLALEDIHEFDYLSWLMGEIRYIDLVETDKSYEASIHFKSGKMATVHGDGLAENYTRRMIIQTPRYTFDSDIEVDNSMYVKEMEYFIECVREKVMPMNNIKEASITTRRLLEAINRSNYSSTARLTPFTF